MTLQEVKRIWGHASWAVFAVTCLIFATIGTVANGRVNLICSGVGIIIAIWMHTIWSQKMSSPNLWTLLKGVAALTAMASCTISMWGYVEHLPVIKTDSAFFTAIRWGEYGLGIMLWISGLFITVYVAWHLLRLLIIHSLK